jgi:hypothetical protein
MLAHSAGVKAVVLDAVGVAAPLELSHPRQFPRLGRDDELAAHRVRQIVLTAERHRLRAPGGSQPRLEAARRVVEPGVDDVGVVARLVAGQARLALDDGDGPAGADDGVGRGQADNAASDHHDIKPWVHGSDQLDAGSRWSTAQVAT